MDILKSKCIDENLMIGQIQSDGVTIETGDSCQRNHAVLLLESLLHGKYTEELEYASQALIKGGVWRRSIYDHLWVGEFTRGSRDQGKAPTMFHAYWRNREIDEIEDTLNW